MVDVVKDRERELRALRLLPPDPEHLALALDCRADREIAGAVCDRAVLADLDHQAVQPDDRIDALQWPRAPRIDVGQDGVGDPRDRVATDRRGALETGEVALDVAHRHAAGVEVQDPLV